MHVCYTQLADPSFQCSSPLIKCEASVAGFISDAAKFSVQASPPHRLFSLDEINAATSNFNKTTLMGEGSTGKVPSVRELDSMEQCNTVY